MKTLRQYIKEAEGQKTALGHFNFSNIEGLWAIFRAAESLALPVIVGVSEGERDFVGLRQAVALVRSIRESASGGNYPIFLNADHTYSFDRVKEAVDAGFDAVIFDGAALPLEENIKITKDCVEYAKSKNPDILVEGELGFIGTSSKLLGAVPVGVAVSGEALVDSDEAAQFVKETGVDLFAPAVGNVHGMLKGRPDPKLDIKRIKLIHRAVTTPLVLHGASGNSEEELRAAIAAGIAIVHVNTELRVAFRDALKLSLQEYPDEIAPYKILKESVSAVEKVVENKLKLFSGRKKNGEENF